MHFSNGKIVEDWHLEDHLTLMQQPGVVSPKIEHLMVFKETTE
ncbi:hypothetical protein [Bacillus salipaludis]